MKYLGGVLELHTGEKITSSNDGAGGETVGNRAGLRGLQRHDHLHGLHLRRGREGGRGVG